MDRPLLPWQRVIVSGPSMVPTLRDADVVLVRHGAAVRPGDVVLARFRALPDRLVLKRVVRAEADGWWLASDNTFAGGDSASHGVADVLGRVVLRLGPGRPSRVRRGGAFGHA
ncbi:MAG: S24 family peptidase [Actinobacteria bacterium]|nr:S24 family peptidase [Actinomycetota bacterium]